MKQAALRVLEPAFFNACFDDGPATVDVIGASIMAKLPKYMASTCLDSDISRALFASMRS